ncbi:MAG: phosphoribosylglycinamide formyltransferase [Niabella sp.]
MSVKLAVFASGAGSNAKKMIGYFKEKNTASVSLIVCNNPNAGVIPIAKKEGVELMMIERERFLKGDGYLSELQKRGIDLIVLAGFLWKVPATLIQAYPKKIINIHPALLPKFGGKGMYGAKVHAAVIEAGEKESGITIHYVDEIYDHGETIFQATCNISAYDTPGSLAQKVHELEHRYFSEVVEKIILKNKYLP